MLLTNRCLAPIMVAMVLLISSRSAHALPVMPVGPFAGNISESWETFSSGPLPSPTNIMSGAASISDDVPDTMEVFPPPAFGLGSSGTAQPINVQALSINDNLPSLTTITFDSPTPAFGAYWAATTVGATPANITVRFYDTLDNELDSVVISYLQPGVGSLDWNGWTAASGEAFAKVTFSGSEVVIDELQAFSAAVPEPSALVMLLTGAAGLIGYACVSRLRRAA